MKLFTMSQQSSGNNQEKEEKKEEFIDHWQWAGKLSEDQRYSKQQNDKIIKCL